MKSILFSAGFFFYLSIANAQQLNTAKLDSFLTTLRSKGLERGSLVISSDGRIQYQQGAGSTKSYRIGSVTKLFTAVLIFTLIEEGNLTLDQHLQLYFPELPNAASITIADLLYHRSGLHDYTKDTDFANWMDQKRSAVELLTIIQQKGSDFKPGEKSEYSNSNFLVLGYIIEKICKKSYAEVLKNRITDPLNLRYTTLRSETQLNNPERLSYKYNNGNWIPEKSTDLSIHGGAGSIVSTTGDMVLFMDALFKYKLISKASVDKMTTIVNEYGMGIFTNKYGRQKSYGHNGRIEEFYAALWFYPEANLSIAYCTDGIHYSRTDLIEGVLNICFNEPFRLPFSNYRNESLESYAGNYSNDQITVSCTVKEKQLIIETRGAKFELEQINVNYFMHRSSGYYFEFFPQEGELQIKETDNIYYLKKR
jgi:CubicO group peptidase (beta-lactamase class C family)